MNDGFIVISRKLLDWKYYSNDHAYKLWTHLLLKANWKDGWFMGTKIERGSLVTSVKKLADELGYSPTTIKRWLKVFEADQQIARKVTSKYTQIIIVNYGLYQDIKKAGDQQSDQPSGQQSDQQGDHNITKEQRNKNNNTERVGHFVPPTMDEVKDLWTKRQYFSDYTRFWNYYQSNGWHAGRVKMQDWKASAAGWESRERQSASRSGRQRVPDFNDPYAHKETHETAEEILARRLRDGV